MYTAPSHYPIPPEVTAFQSDMENLGMICDGEHWYVTPAWAEKFQTHLAKLLPVATAGNPWAQYAVATIYMGGYVYSSQDECFANYENDAKELSSWLEKCARQGFVAAVDNLITVGVGAEAERLRGIARAVESQSVIPRNEQGMPTYPPSFCEKVWLLAYGQDNWQRA